MKGCTQWNLVYSWKDFRRKVGSNLCPPASAQPTEDHEFEKNSIKITVAGYNSSMAEVSDCETGCCGFDP